MPKWYLFAVFILLILLAAAFPWRRVPPRHAFVFEQLRRLQEIGPGDEPPAMEDPGRDLVACAGRSDRVGSAHL